MLNRLFTWRTALLAAALIWASQSTETARAQEHGTAPHAEAPADAAGHNKADAHANDAHGDAHAEGGQRSPIEWKTDLALWSLVTFVLFLGVLRFFAWGPLMTGLGKREANLRHDIEQAEASRKKAEQMLAEHSAKLHKVQDEIREILAEARRDADHTKNDIIATAQREAEATKKRAIQEIQTVRDQALDELFTHMAGAVTRATEQVLRRTLNDGDRERLVGDALSEFASRQGGNTAVLNN